MPGELRIGGGYGARLNDRAVRNVSVDGARGHGRAQLHGEGRCVLVWDQSVGTAHAEDPVRWHAADAGKVGEER